MSTPSGNPSRRLGVATALVLTAGLATGVTAAPLFLGAADKPLVVLHVAVASSFFAALAVKLVLLGTRARLARARWSWELLIAHGGSLLAGYTLLTGALLMLDPAWSDQHLAASFWFAAITTVHGRHYATRLRGLLASKSDPRPSPDCRVRTALRCLDAAAIALLDLSLRKTMSDTELAVFLDTDAERVRQLRERAIGRLGGSGDTMEAELRRLPADAWRLPMRRSGRRLVVVGGGMAGQALVEELVRRGDWRLTLVAEEDVEPYDRTRLSELLRQPAGERLELRPRRWYSESGVELRLAAAATAVDLSRQRLIDRTGAEHPYDALVMATGSRAFVPPIPGTGLAHVFPYRTRRDAEAIAYRARQVRTAVVIGGGLLGLEAAGALRELDVAVTVVEAADRLMPQQLDAGGAAILARSLARLGVETHVASSVAAIWPTEVELGDGRQLPADLVVVAAGVRAETTLATDAGLEVRHGVVVDDEMRTSARGVWAVGECAEHRGVVQGLWPPVLRQVRAAVASLLGAPLPFEAAPAQASLKVAGIDLLVVGRISSGPGDEEVVRSDGRSGTYAKLVLEGDRLAGAILMGDTACAPALRRLAATGAPVPVDVLDAPIAEPNGVVICQCMHVTPERIRRAVEDEGAADLETVSAVTGAATGCGSCADAVSRLVADRCGMPAVE